MMNFLSKSINFLAEVQSRNNKQQSTKEHPLCGFSNTSEVVQSCLTLCNPVDCSLPASSIHGIFQARVLESVTSAFSNTLNMYSFLHVNHTSKKLFKRKRNVSLSIFSFWIATFC